MSTHSTFGTSDEKALRSAAELAKRAVRSQHEDWDKLQWSSFRDDLVMFSLYELPVLLRMAGESS